MAIKLWWVVTMNCLNVAKKPTLVIRYLSVIEPLPTLEEPAIGSPLPNDFLLLRATLNLGQVNIALALTTFQDRCHERRVAYQELVVDGLGHGVVGIEHPERPDYRRR